MMRTTILTLTAAGLGLASLAATAQAAGYSSTARDGYYYDQGVYVPARPDVRADLLQRRGGMPAGEGRAFVPDIPLTSALPARPMHRGPEPLVDRDGDRQLDYYYDQGRYVKAFPD